MAGQYECWKLNVPEEVKMRPLAGGADAHRRYEQDQDVQTQAGRSGFTAINRPNLTHNPTQVPDSIATAEDPSHYHVPILAHYLGLGDPVGGNGLYQSRFDPRSTGSPTVILSDEEATDSKKNSRKSPKKRSSTAPPKTSRRVKKAKTTPIKSVSEVVRVTESGIHGKVAESILSSSTAPRVSNLESIELPLSLNTFAACTPPAHPVQAFNAWKTPTTSFTNLSYRQSEISFSVPDDPLPSGIPLNISFEARTIASRSFGEGRIVQNKEPSSEFTNVPFPSANFRSLQPIDETARSQSPKYQILENVSEEQSRLLDISNIVVSRVEPKELLEEVPTDRNEAPARRVCNELISLTNDGYHSDEFEGLADNDFLALNLAAKLNHSAHTESCIRNCNSNNMLPTPQTSDPVHACSPITAAGRIGDANEDQHSWIEFDDEDEVDFADLTDAIRETISVPSLSLVTSPISRVKPSQQVSPLRPDVRAPQTITTETHSVPVESLQNHMHLMKHPRIVRPPFPKSIRDRSLIVGVSAAKCLRTCFRIGEALNAGCDAARNSAPGTLSSSILIEIYAKVVSSHRDEKGVKQHFTLGDLYHENRAPFIRATSECWKGSDLWEYDCGRLLFSVDGKEEKKLCRAVGNMRRDGNEWTFVLLNIWEATWEDVEHVRGIICGGC